MLTLLLTKYLISAQRRVVRLSHRSTNPTGGAGRIAQHKDGLIAVVTTASRLAERHGNSPGRPPSGGSDEYFAGLRIQWERNGDVRMGVRVIGLKEQRVP